MHIFPHINKEETCCFTGPRPEKITEDISIIRESLRKSIIGAANSGYKNFITGMSRGFDLIAAQVVIELQEELDINLVCAIPYLDQDSLWSKSDKEKYNDVITKATYSICLSDKFIRGIYHTRNRFMIDYSSLIIAYYNNTQGGTKYTIDYATTQKKPIVNLYFEQEQLALT